MISINAPRLMDSERPYWLTTIQARFDVARLRPPALPSGQRFETPDDVIRLSERYENVLSGTSRAVLQDCRQGYYTCGRPACPLCARGYRRWFIGETLRLLSSKDLGRGRILTLYLDTVLVGQLDSVHLGRLHARLRKRLFRCGFGGAVVIGGTEIGYRATENVWLVHVHALAIDAHEDAIEALKAMDTDDHDRAIEVQLLRDPLKQLSYLQKFGTYHRPIPRSGARNTPAFPIPNAALRELLSWWSGTTFDEFRFLLGLRRRGSRLVPLAHFF